MTKSQLAKYVAEVTEALVGTLDDDYPDTIDTIVIEIADRDGLSDAEIEEIFVNL